MIRKYVGIAAIVIGMAGAACTPAEEAPTQLPSFTFPNSPLQTQQQLLPDFSVFTPPVQVDEKFATFIGPSIWELVPPGGKTYEGTVEYLVEALDGKGKVIASYEGKFKRQQPDVARDNHLLLSELVTILLATERQMKNPAPNGFAANPRYMIPSNAVAVRVTADPKDRIKETDENNNMLFLKLPTVYRTY